MKQVTLVTIPLLCAAFAPLCADAQADKAAADKQKMYMDEMNKITPSGEPAVTRWADPYLTADFIWWRAQEDGLDYAFTGTTPIIHDTDKGRIRHPKFKYEPGFKVGMGLKFRHDGWDTFAQYTRLNFEKSRTRSHLHSDADGDSNVQSNIVMPFEGDLITFWADRARSKWGLNFNVLDLELGRNFWISKWLTMRPFIGMKFDWTKQRFRANYDDISGNSAVSILGADVKMKMKQRQWAVGLRAGLNTAWYMWRKWCIFGELALSGMLNHFTAHRTDRIEDAMGNEWTQNHVNRHSRPVTAVMEWALGLRFETAFHNDDYMFQLSAAWEEQIWFGQNQFTFFPSGTGSQNLSFEGLTIKAAFYF